MEEKEQFNEITKKPFFESLEDLKAAFEQLENDNIVMFDGDAKQNIILISGN